VCFSRISAPAHFAMVLLGAHKGRDVGFVKPRDLQLLGLHLTLVGKRMLRIIRKRLHPTAQL
jgi:hypothetical protein